ncbi:hypothetical protein BOTBODRAFT_42031 [Botryobasidium botryosum FD-172 SS1]|uniref:Uncharacterized protein n=1 Tax=Botryobasidium botryosum (strain FD-172 SS1) TaxID=930990 RepID=A0A067MTS2_BOTB1|nr:hypothetical protein BOTBODRAFT_42031 [Botryobasidium botryosum FD-172 SS1]
MAAKKSEASRELSSIWEQTVLFVRTIAERLEADVFIPGYRVFVEMSNVNPFTTIFLGLFSAVAIPFLLSFIGFASFVFALLLTIAIGGAFICATTIVGIVAIFLFAILSIVLLISLFFTATGFALFLCLRLIFHTQDVRGKGIAGWKEECSNRIGLPTPPDLAAAPQIPLKLEDEDASPPALKLA